MAGKTTSKSTTKEAPGVTAKKATTPSKSAATTPAAPAAAPKSTPPAPVAKALPTAAAKKTKPETPTVEFSLDAPDALTVVVTGDFNAWNLSEHQAKRNKNGVWKKKIALTPGRHEYLFLVDGHWWTDPLNPETATNPFGTVNSVLEV